MQVQGKIAYIDASSGVSGDMLVGALLDLGVPLSYVVEKLSFLPENCFSLSSRQVKRLGLSATKFDVRLLDGCPHKHGKWGGVEDTLRNAPLDVKIRDAGHEVFRALFEAEAFVHGTTLEETHLHELSAIDCMVDVLGFLVAADYLGIDCFYVSSVNVGSGTVNTHHGLLSVPAPAVAELLKGLQVYSSATGVELATPTGAALLKTLATPLAAMPELSLEGVGSGAGEIELTERPNVLRVFIGRAGISEYASISTSESPPESASEISSESASESGEVMVVETNIDDMSPQLYEHVSEKLFGAGALDVFTAPIAMKKGRPAIKLSVIAPPSAMERIFGCLFGETTTIGVRYYPVRRETLLRSIVKVATPYGEVRVKVAKRKGRIVNVAPEFEDLRRLANEHGVPLKKIFTEVNRRIDPV
ncbi:MAG: nickel pincer cofactor biosynthesis protein LarC [Nitrospirae bacterium]|nr:nickel pincer cofactor biosynthesis protein LarC [Nitrospirota bacterium]